jgi:hypothetical protein
MNSIWSENIRNERVRFIAEAPPIFDISQSSASSSEHSYLRRSQNSETQFEIEVKRSETSKN